MTAKTAYSRLQIALHWLIALGVLFNYFVSEGMEEAFDFMLEGEGSAPDSVVPTLHVWVGTTVLALVLLRIVVRLMDGAPAAGSSLAEQLAAWGHRALYALMLLVPLAGAIAWYGKTEATPDLHVLGANILMIVAGGHALVALFHHFVLKDGLMVRMMRAR